jgi:hypothetical protein
VFDPTRHQAAGLRTVCTPAAVKLMPVSLNRDAAAACDMVWVLSAGLSMLGHGVVVLDATTREHGDRPGLSQHLRGERLDPSSIDDGPYILAAQAGIDELLATAPAMRAPAALERLAGSFAAGTVVLLLAHKEWLSVLFEGSGARPLIPFHVEPTGVIDAYSAVKVLTQAGNMQPILVPIGGEGPEELERRVVDVLLETARKHLGQVPDCWALPDSRHDESPDALSPWVLKIVQSALSLGDGSSLRPWMSPNPRAAFVPHLWSC